MKKEKKRIVRLIPVMIGIIVCIWGFVSRANFNRTSTPNWNHTQDQQYPSITITKNAWSAEVNTSGCNSFRIISVEPPVRRWVMVNNDSSRVTPLPPGPANEVNVGRDVKSVKWMIMSDEGAAVSTIKYDIRR